MSYSSKKSKQDLEPAQKFVKKSAVAAFVDQRASTVAQLEQQQVMRSSPNNTGLPDNLKSGVENLSGYSMDDVKVHYNSDKPAQLNAHAYAQGTDIHVAPGQEHHLPHEAWHVVQQKQGRVQATMQMKAGVPVNDDAGLENEADVMGAKALGLDTVQRRPLSNNNGALRGVVQRETEINYETQSVQYEDALGNQKSENVGKVADAFIDVRDEVSGSAPDNQQKVMYDRLKEVYGQTFIRGHLLNDHVGGIGEVYNLFPITSSANSEHKITAEGNLKKHIRGEYNAIKGVATKPTFIRYRVEAVAAQPANLTNNANAVFNCLMVSRNTGLPDGENQQWTVYSQPGAKVTALGDRSTKQDYSNSDLGNFGASGKGEDISTFQSRIRSTVNGWKGDQHGSFLIGGSFNDFVSLSEAKDKCLKEIEDYIEKDAFLEGHMDDICKQSRKRLKDVHDSPTLQTEISSIKDEIFKFELNIKKHSFLEQVKTYLTNTTIPDQAKGEIFNLVNQYIATLNDLNAFNQAITLFPDWLDQVLKMIQAKSGTQQ